MKQLRYPKERLTDESDYLKMFISKYVPISRDKVANTDLLSSGTASQRIQNNLKSPLTQIILPIPRNIQDTLPVDWTDGSLNPLEAFALQAGTSIVQSGRGGLGEVGSEIQNQVDNARKALGNVDTPQQNAIVAGLVGRAIGQNFNQATSRATGQVLNPNLELLFNGVNLRIFTFNFEFFPRNQSEANEVKEIFRCLKHATVPDKSRNGLFIEAPYIFELQYMKGNREHPFLNKFLPMAMTNISVNYTASNRYSTFHDGTPTHMTARMEFKELNPIYKEDYDKAQGGVGY